ncbi:MAG: hypothetical protein NTX88_01165, partial [Candidatus Atribacteria bacterium]|nr:hypothetical protein [Candidatus Atribacteria bacterium]
FPKLAANVSWTAAVENVRICTQEVKNSKYTKEHGFGWAATDLWAKVEEEMINSKGLDPAKKVDVNTFITNQFIESANKFDHDAIVKQANEYQLKSH